MKRSELGSLACSLAGSLAEVGDAWSLLIVKELLLRNRRFDGIAAQMGVSDSSLASRLKRLEGLGIIERRAYRERPVRYEYRLTAKGQDLWPVLVTLTGWGDRWQGRETPPLTYGCIACGVADARPHLACESCGELLDPRSVAATESDAMRAERATRASAD
jgi:DNA-binding HxlR family transcriptional regulator